jgi:hypothetical protein
MYNVKIAFANIANPRIIPMRLNENNKVPIKIIKMHLFLASIS